MGATEPLEPEVVAALEAIDATLQGEPVDPELAELAELALILRDDRPAADPAFLNRLDRRAAARFAPLPRSPRAPARWARLRASQGAWASAAIAVVVIASFGGILIAFGGRSGTQSASSSNAHDAARAAPSSADGASSGAGSAAGSAASPATATATTPAPHGAKVPATAPGPHGGGDIAQSANLTLRARAGRVDAVAQLLFDVIAAEHGTVTNSQITSQSVGPSSGEFQLRVPSARLESTLDRLSRLRGARVVARQDASADISSQIGGAASRLAIARALHRSLLSQLAAADTGAQDTRLEAELHRNVVAIAGDEAALARLHGRVSDSSIVVNVSAPAPTRTHRRAHAAGFAIAGALHDAGRILLVAAGVALIALAVLVPVGAVAACSAWAWSLVLRRRREAALGP
jgi:hypothetical protein